MTMIPIYSGDHITKSPTFIFFAFSLLRTKRLIPMHQGTIHTGSFAKFVFQKMKYTLKRLKKQSLLMEYELYYILAVKQLIKPGNFNSSSIFISLVTKDILRGWNNGTLINLLRVPIYRPNRQYKARTAEMA